MPENRVYNFSAGPSQLPEEVLETYSQQMKNYEGAGMGVMEMSHRSKEFVKIFEEAEKDMRDLLGVPQNYKVMFFQGGATLQFASVPLNLLGAGKKTCDYAVTGQWTEKAQKEAAKYGTSNKVCDTKPEKYTRVPPQSEWKMSSPEDTAYFHYCDNETVNGVEFQFVPEVNVPMVCDMSSNFLTRKVDVSKYALIYAGAQKNCGPAGNTIVMVDEAFLGKELDICPQYCSYKSCVDAAGMLNTPACYSIYACGVYFKYMKEKGGVAHFEELADKKSRLIYDAIDGSDGYYTSPIQKDSRSRVNIPFQIKGGDEPLEKKFLEEAKKQNLFTLAGHRSVGGCRASLYNGMPMEGVQALESFMKSFAQENAA